MDSWIHCAKRPEPSSLFALVLKKMNLGAKHAYVHRGRESEYVRLNVSTLQWTRQSLDQSLFDVSEIAHLQNSGSALIRDGSKKVRKR